MINQGAAYRWLPVLLVITSFISCADSASLPDQTLGKGDLTGKVTLIDSTGSFITDKGGVTVQVEGTSFSSISDSAGFWTIRQLPTKSYNLLFSKPSYSTTKDMGYSFIAGKSEAWHKDIQLIQKAAAYCTLDSLNMPTPTKQGSFVCYSYNTSSRVNYDFFISRDPAVDFNSLTSNKFGGFGYSTTKIGSKVRLRIVFSNTNFNKGDTVYFRAYPYFYKLSYFDITTLRNIFSGYAEGSNVLSAIVQ